MMRLFGLRSRFLSFFAFISLVLFFCCSQGGFAAQVAAAAVPQAIGQVVWVKGTVQAIQPGHSERTLKRRDVIFAQDTIVTDATSTGEIVFTDSSVVALHSGTELKIDNYKYDPNAPGDNKYIASIAKGGFRTITGLISKGHPENYQVNTPVATIGVRGTDYSLFINGKTLSLGINKGAIVAINTAGEYELNKLKTLPFAEIAGVGKPATFTKIQPAGLVGVPALTPAQAPSKAMLQQHVNSQLNAAGKTTATFGGTSGGGGTTPPGGSSSGGTSSGGSSSSGSSSSSSSSSGTTSSGGTNTSGGGSDTTVGGSSSSVGSTTTTTVTSPSSPSPSAAGGTVCIGK